MTEITQKKDPQMQDPLMQVPLSEQELCPKDLLAEQEAAFARDVARIQARKSEFVQVVCPACGAPEFHFRFAKYSFDYVNCDQCQTLYMNPRPSPAVMADYYANSENYAYWAKYIFPASEESRKEKIHKPRLETILNYLREYQIQPGVMVEVGPGFGTFSAVAIESDQFERVLAIEPTPELVQACEQRGVEVIPKRIEDVTPDELPPVDLLVSFEVIEHLFEPRDFVAQCFHLLKPGGLLILSCPNGQGFDIDLLQAESLAVDPEHVNLFHPESLGNLLSSLGFEVLKRLTPGRLDAEFVREAVLQGRYSLSGNPFLERVLIRQWDELGWPFQQFLADQGLSAHMWLVARKPL